MGFLLYPLVKVSPTLDTRFFRHTEPKVVGMRSTNSPHGSLIKMVSGAIPISTCFPSLVYATYWGLMATRMAIGWGYILHPKGCCPTLSGNHFQVGTSAAPSKAHSIVWSGQQLLQYMIWPVDPLATSPPFYPQLWSPLIRFNARWDPVSVNPHMILVLESCKQERQDPYLEHVSILVKVNALSRVEGVQCRQLAIKWVAVLLEGWVLYEGLSSDLCNTQVKG